MCAQIYVGFILWDLLSRISVADSGFYVKVIFTICVAVSMNAWTEIKRRCNELFRRSTVHGLAHASHSRTAITTLFWIILLLASTCGFGFNLVFIIERFYSKPLLTSYFSDYEDFKWPDITFCNHVPVRLAANAKVNKKWQELLLKASQYRMVDIPFMQRFDMGGVDACRTLGNVSEVREMCYATNELINITMALSSLNPQEFRFSDRDSFIRTAGINMKRVIIEHSIEIGGQWDPFDPGPGFFPMLHYIRHRTPCYTFRLSRIGNAISEKLVNGLMFVLDIDYQTYEIFNSNFLHSGAQLYITLSNHLPGAKGILILPGHTTDISLRMLRTKYYKPKRDCRTNDFHAEIYDPLLISASTYSTSAQDCVRLLSQKLYHENCRCFVPFLPIPKLGDHEPHLCFNMTHYTRREILQNARCLAQVYHNNKNETRFRPLVEAECGELTLEKCNKLTYEVNSNTEMWVELWTKEISANRLKFMESLRELTQNDSMRYSNDTLGRIRRNIANIVITREKEKGDLVQEEIEYPMSQLLSDIGGLMGLWIGLSVVGCFEFVELMVILIRGAYYARREVQKRRLTERELDKGSNGDTGGVGANCLMMNNSVSAETTLLSANSRTDGNVYGKPENCNGSAPAANAGELWCSRSHYNDLTGIFRTTQI